MINILLLIGGFAALLYGATILVDSASSLAGRLSIPNIVIGLTVVAFGTSSPELVVNLLASHAKNSDIVLGNIVGSNILNILLILGIASVIIPLRVKTETTWYQVPLALLSALAVAVMGNDIFLSGDTNSFINRADGIILLLFFAIFLVYNLQLALKGNSETDVVIKEMSLKKSVFLLILGLILLSLGGRFIVQSATELAIMAGISERVIALTIVSIGTSLPELATSVVAARKGNTDIAIGNVVGSNIFNVFFILGISAIINPVAISGGANTDMILNIAVSLLLFIFIFTGKGRRIERWEGIGFLLIYSFYLIYLIAF